MFITFEGLDFCGKSTQVKLLRNYLVRQGKDVKLIREPGGTKISEKVREILLDKNNLEMSPETELLLFTASRIQLVKEVIIPNLKKDVFVISDRFHHSSIAYQGFGRGLDLDFVESLQSFAIQGALPDITFLLDISVEEVNKRKEEFEHQNLDRIELSKNRFYENVREGYLYLEKKELYIKRIDGSLPIDTIHRQIISEIKKFKTNADYLNE
ncbi:thymidylate kinase [bacterium BMS3Abin04]|nr:thymidylate kinase [bacterium BMS3Abin04]